MDACKRFAGAAALFIVLAGRALASQIEYFEPITIHADAAQTEFNAYGHRFTAKLESNEPLLTRLKAQKPSLSPTLRVLRGTLTDIPNSWLRLVENNGHVEGAFSDGDDYYTVTTYGQIAKLVSVPTNIPSSQSVVFRLSDAPSLLRNASCAVPESDGERITQYKRLTRELQAMSLPTKQLNISIIGDNALQNQYSATATDVLIGIANIVDGIFADQVGVLIEPSDVRLIPATSDPFTGTNPDTLLSQLSNFRVSTPAVANQGLAYLVTGKDLDADVAGIGYIASLCDPAKSAALGEATFTPSIGALIAAHEFGHVFGAPHDAQAGSACASEAPTYLMNPTINNSSRFSQCSLNKMQPVIQAASCLTTAGPWSDVAVSIGEASSSPENSTPFSFPITVTSDGTTAAQNVTLSANVSPTWEMSASASAGNCTVQTQILSCDFGSLNAGETRQVTITAMSHDAQTFTVSAGVTADGDRLPSNSHASKQFVVTRTADAAVSIDPNPLTVYAEAQTQAVVRIASLLSKPVRDVAVTMQTPITLQTAQVAGGSCTISGTSATCTIASIAGGSTAQITLLGTAPSRVGAGDLFVSMSASNDDNSNNNVANAAVNVIPRRDVALTGPTGTQIAAINESRQLVFEIASIGVDPVDDVKYEIDFVGIGEFESVTSDVGTCTTSSLERYCSFGTMQPGTKHTVTVVVHGTQVWMTELRSYLSAANDQQGNNNRVQSQLDVRYPHEVALGSVLSDDGFEGAPINVRATIMSNGVLASTNTVASIQVPAAMRVVSASIPNGTCSRISETRIDCILASIATDGRAEVSAQIIGDVPGSYAVHVSVSADADGNLANNAVDRTIVVRPFTDIGVREVTEVRALAGSVLTIPITVFTGPRPLASASVDLQIPWVVSLQSITASTGTCSMMYISISCTFSDLPANTEAQITLQVRATASGSASLTVNAYTPIDAAFGNNSQTTTVAILDPSDASLVLTQESVNATLPFGFAYPQLTITGTAAMPEVDVEITIPDSITVTQATSSAGLCTTDHPVKCKLSLVGPTYNASINLVLAASVAGSFASTITLNAFNDSTPDNNTRTVQISVAAASTSPPPSSPVSSGNHSSGGGGGGGNMDWMLLLLLVGVLVLRCQPRSIRSIYGR